MPVADTVTVTRQSADAFPAVAVIIAIPLLTAVTRPLLTVATAVLLEDQVTVLSLALAGRMVAVKSRPFPTSSAISS